MEFMGDHGFAWQVDERRWQLSQENERLAACVSRVGVMKEELNEMPNGAVLGKGVTRRTFEWKSFEAED